MSLPEIERLARLVRDMDSAAAPGDIAAKGVEALRLMRRIEDDLSARRNDALCALYRSGESLQKLHERTGLSRARVHQIVQTAQQ